MERNVRRIRSATLVLCLFILYCVLLSQGLKANALSTFFGALAAVPLTVHLYNRFDAWVSEVKPHKPQTNSQQ
jgi:predicted PurR-regulated permease PerM